MKRLLRIYRRYCVTAVVLAIVLIGVNITGILGLSWYNMVHSDEGNRSKLTFRSVADQLVEKTQEGYALSGGRILSGGQQGGFFDAAG